MKIGAYIKDAPVLNNTEKYDLDKFGTLFPEDDRDTVTILVKVPRAEADAGLALMAQVGLNGVISK